MCARTASRFGFPPRQYLRGKRLPALFRTWRSEMLGEDSEAGGQPQDLREEVREVRGQPTQAIAAAPD